MGAMCCKSQQFQGQGHRLEQEPKVVPINSNRQQPQPQSNSNSRRLITTANDLSRKEAAANAAEARAKAASTRGTNHHKTGSDGGQLSKSLAQQASDGGRREEAIAAGTNAPNAQKPLVWD